MAKGIWCFSTPSLEVAVNHRSDYFGWMRNGAALYKNLDTSGFSLFAGTRLLAQRVCFETFPHAIACALQGEVVPAEGKRKTRRELLQNNAINVEALTNIDWIDAGLCALTAHRFMIGSIKTYGDIEEGMIVVPA